MGLNDWVYLQKSLFKEQGINTNDTKLILYLSDTLRIYKNCEFNLATINKCRILMNEKLQERED